MPNSIACIITRTFSFFLAVSSTGVLLDSDAQNECHKSGRCGKAKKGTFRLSLVKNLNVPFSAEARLHAPVDEREQTREDRAQHQGRHGDVDEAGAALDDPAQRDLVPARRKETADLADAVRNELIRH